MRALAFLVLLLGLLASAAASERLPDACARLDLPDVAALREECNAATLKAYSMPVAWYIENGHYRKLNDSRTVPGVCKDGENLDECLMALTAKTSAAIADWSDAVAKFARASQQYAEDTEKQIAAHNECMKHGCHSQNSFAYNALLLFSVVYSFCFVIYPGAFPRRS